MERSTYDRVRRDGYKVGFAAALAMLRQPSEELLQKSIFAGCNLSGGCECNDTCRLLDDTDRKEMRAVLSAAADAMERT